MLHFTRPPTRHRYTIAYNTQSTGHIHTFIISKYALTRPRTPSLLWSFSRCRCYLKTRWPLSGLLRACQAHPCICIHENKTGKHREHSGITYLSTTYSIVTNISRSRDNSETFLSVQGAGRKSCSSAKTSRGGNRTALARRGHQNRTEAGASACGRCDALS